VPHENPFNPLVHPLLIMHMLAESTVGLSFVMMMKEWDWNGLDDVVTPFHM
jgi:hypothetical protein